MRDARARTVLVPRFSTRHFSTARSPGLTVTLRGVGLNTDRDGYETAGTPPRPRAAGPGLSAAAAAAAVSSAAGTATSRRDRRADDTATSPTSAPAATSQRHDTTRTSLCSASYVRSHGGTPRIRCCRAVLRPHAAVAINRYLLPAGPTAANAPHRPHAEQWAKHRREDRQTEGHHTVT